MPYEKGVVTNHKGRKKGTKNKISDETAFLFQEAGYNPLLEMIEQAMDLKGSQDPYDKQMFFALNKELCTYLFPKLKAVTISVEEKKQSHENWLEILKDSNVLENDDVKIIEAK